MKNLIASFIFLICNSTALAADGDAPKTWIDIPIIETPFNTDGSYFPKLFSMRQSLRLSNSYYQNIHYLIAGNPEEEKTTIWEFVFLGVFDYVGGTTPLSNGWTHEEWHRAVLTRRGIGSFNDMNTFPMGASVIAVSHVDDQDLVDLKKNHPAEQVRLSAAGMEAQVQQNLALEENRFFKQSRSEDRVLLWLNALNVYSYMATCASEDSNKTTDDENREDGVNIPRRDFTGLDCNAWVYDLFRPDEPYAARGVHPSGVGLDRYIKYSDLNEKEQTFLKKQTSYSFLNLADPFLLGFNEFNSKWFDRDVRWNFKLNHMLTSFGATIDANLFLGMNENQYLVILHNGMTDTRYLPGITAKQVDLPITDKWFATPALTLWQQPVDQRIENNRDETLIDASVEVSYVPSRWIAYYFGLEAKNSGWMAGNVYLDKNVSGWAGLRTTIF